MKVRIYKTDSGEVVIDTPAKRYQGDNIGNCPHPGRFRDSNPAKESFTMEIVDVSDLEKLVVGGNEAGSLQFYYDGKTLKHDNGWNEKLMNVELIKQKHHARVSKKIDEELKKETPDPVTLARLQRDKETLPDKTDKEAYQIAIANLDEDGHTKSKVRTQLASKVDGAK